MVLDNDVDNVMKDVGNITETLSSLTGLNVQAYEVDEHKSILDEPLVALEPDHPVLTK